MLIKVIYDVMLNNKMGTLFDLTKGWFLLASTLIRVLSEVVIQNDAMQYM